MPQASELPTIKPDTRGPEYFQRYHTRTRTKEPNLVYAVCRMVLTPTLFFVYRTRAWGVENVPANGPVIIAPVHESYMDHFLVATPVTRRFQFMAKSTMFVWPIDWIMSNGGTFPVRRGQRDRESVATGLAILRRECVLCMYPNGGRTRGARKIHAGVGELALKTGAAVVPVGIQGSDKIRYWKRIPPRINIHYGQPLRWPVEPDPSHERSKAVATEIMDHAYRYERGLEDLVQSGSIAQTTGDRIRLGLGAALGLFLCKKLLQR